MSDKKLTYALIAISDIVGKVPGIDSAPEYISDKIPPGVWAMSYLAGGDFQHDPQGVLKGLHNIGLYVCCARVNLTSVLHRLYPLGELVAGALESNPTLYDTVETFGNISYTFSYSMNVGTAQSPAYIAGWNFTINQVKIQSTTAISLS